jgi:hypothetical protein
MQSEVNIVRWLFPKENAICGNLEKESKAEKAVRNIVGARKSM